MGAIAENSPSPAKLRPSLVKNIRSLVTGDPPLLTISASLLLVDPPL